MSLRFRQEVQEVSRLLIAFRHLMVPAIVILIAMVGANAQNSSQLTSRELLDAGKVEEAITTLKRSIAANHKDAEAWHFLGLAYLYIPDYKSAEKAFKEAIKLRPQYIEARNGLAFTLLSSGKPGDAGEEAKRALTINPINADTNYLLGLINLRNGHRAAAINYSTKAIELNPKLAEAYLVKTQALIGGPNGTLFTGAGIPSTSEGVRMFSEAVQLIDKYLQLSPNAEASKTWADLQEGLRLYIADYAKKDSKNLKDSHTVDAEKELTTKLRLISKPEPSYTTEAKKEQVAGTVLLRAVFGADGLVKHIIIVHGLKYGLTERSVAAARQIKFEPATRDGQKVSVIMQLEYNFNLY